MPNVGNGMLFLATPKLSAHLKEERVKITSTFLIYININIRKTINHIGPNLYVKRL